MAVIRSIANALELSAEELLAQAAGITDDGPKGVSVEAAIRADTRLTTSQKSALIAVYRSMAAGGGARQGPVRPTERATPPREG